MTPVVRKGTLPGRNELHVWQIPLISRCQDLQDASKVLAVDERQRAGRFRFDIHRSRYILTHAAVRRILGSYLDQDARSILFEYSTYGKPAIPEHNISFNLSHAENHALFALARSRVGIDIEFIRDINNLAELIRMFSPNEQMELLSQPLDQRTRTFFQCWTRKEAYIKALGLGFSLPLNSFDVSFTSSEPARLRASRDPIVHADDWILYEVAVPPGYVAAAAIEAREPVALHQFQWTWS